MELKENRDKIGTDNDDPLAQLGNKSLTIVVNTDLQQNVRQNSNIDIDINIDIKNQNILEFSGTLEVLKEDLLDEIEDDKIRHQLSREFEKVEQALKDIEKAKTPEQAKEKTGAFKRIESFIEKLTDGNKTVGKAVNALEGGLEQAQKLASFYNKVAPWAGLPKVPEVLLDKN